MRQICPYEDKFGKFMHIQNFGTVRHIYVYYNIVRTHGLVMQKQNRKHIEQSFRYIIQILLKRNSCIFFTLFKQIQEYLGLWPIQARNVLRIQAYSQSYTYPDMFVHICAYFRRFRHIQDPGITGSKNQHLIFKSGSSSISLFKSFWNIFSFLFQK